MEWLCAAVAREFGISDEPYYVVGLLSACFIACCLALSLVKIIYPKKGWREFYHPLIGIEF